MELCTFEKAYQKSLKHVQNLSYFQKMKAINSNEEIDINMCMC